jgi:7,8-dihydropterin-6-yl-methyl-4-(beta-D-ribofuranosyl)aminobenzene 5'-phosphate synthase
MQQSLTGALRYIAYAQLLMLCVCASLAASEKENRAKIESVRITILFNNVPHRPTLETSWGFAALVETPHHTVLFDTGGDGAILLSNMNRLSIDPHAVEAIVLSHIHSDHTGGLQGLLEHNANVTVYMPASFPLSFRTNVTGYGARVKVVRQSTNLFGSFYSTGEMGSGIKEQALIVDTEPGLIVMTGCAHPNVVDIARRAHEYLGKDIYLLIGGFHMLGMSDREIGDIIDRLEKLGVQRVAPSHCTGNKAVAAFQAAWNNRFIASGCGTVIRIP